MWLDDQLKPGMQRYELGVRHDDGDLDKLIDVHVEARHFAIYPHQQVVVRHAGKSIYGGLTGVEARHLVQNLDVLWQSAELGITKVGDIGHEGIRREHVYFTT